MSAMTPNTNLRLLKVPIELDNKNQLTFSSLEAQYTYFNTLPKLEMEGFTYQRKDSVIRFPAHIDSIIEYNYVMYQNENYTNKWFYAFITDMQYISNNMTAITIKTDVYQTWFNDLTYKASFVEREHVNDDSIGLHTIPEGLETGEYINTQEVEKMLNDPDDFYICMSVTELPDSTIPANNTRVFNGVYGGLYYLVFQTPADCTMAIKMYDKKTKASAITSLFVIPKDLTSVQDADPYTWTMTDVGTCTVYYLPDSDSADTIGVLNGTMPTKVGINYIPVNKKLFTYPYSYMILANNSGTSQVYRYEDFDYDELAQERAIGFWIDASITPGMSMKAIPVFYKNKNLNYNEGIMLGKLPICSWNSDVYLNWLTQNGLNTALSLAGSVTSTGVSIATANPVGLVGGLSGIFSAVQQIRVASLTPDQAKGNTNSGDINFSDDTDGGITLYYMSIKDEYASVIDSYFSMFGYKVNTVKVPNIYGRLNWNYVKTIDCNIIADIPQKDLQEIKSMFNSGVTLWHNPQTFLNYSATNTIVT